jgi:LuxR family maltose regulon positive regulatory protein
MLFWMEVPCVTRCRVLIAEGSAASLREAEERLRGYAATCEAQHNTFQQIVILSLLALACERQGKAKEALVALEHAVTLAEPGGFVFPFIELGAPMANLLHQLRDRNDAPNHVEKLLAVLEQHEATDTGVPAAPEAGPRTSGPSTGALTDPHDRSVVESLTNREVEVLERLSERLYNKEIAGQLHISTETVKAHLKSVYAKLGVRTRRQAIVRAEELGVLQPQ